MNEIEKMYKNAGVKKQKYFSHASFYDGSDVFEEKIPLFTAEKQLELIKWLLDKDDLYLHRHKTDYTYSIAGSKVAVNSYTNLKESICEYVNALWQNLTEEEKQQVITIIAEWLQAEK